MPYLSIVHRVKASWRRCCTCRKRFLSPISDVRRGGGQFCCSVCYHASQVLHPNRGTFRQGNHPSTEFKQGHPKPARAYAFPSGSAHPNWKGTQASYSAFHQRLHRIRGSPSHCEVCGCQKTRRRYHWANLTGRYDDIHDYKQMCVPCHRRFDAKKRRLNRHR